MPSVIYNTFKELGFDNFTIFINNRKILNGLFSSLGLTEKSAEVLRIIDKIEKIGEKAVEEELQKIGVNEQALETIMKFIAIEGSVDEKLEILHPDSICSSDNSSLCTKRLQHNLCFLQ